MRERIRMREVVGPGAVRADLERDGKVQSCVVRQAEDGDPVPPGVDLVHVKETGSGEWYDAETVYRGSGPPQVATPAYREGYDRIFGGGQKVGLA